MMLLTFFVVMIIQVLVAVGGVYKNIKLSRELESSGTISMETMLREIRNASSVDIGSSVLGVNPGTIVVSGVDENMNLYSIEFNLSGGKLQISKNGETPAAITSSVVDVDYLLFSYVSNANSGGVRVELEVSGTSGSVPKSERFYGFAVLRGSY